MNTCTGKRHGDLSAFQNYGCTCPEAVEENRLYRKRRREGRAEIRRVPAVGTTRRIRALWAIGHTAAEIGSAADRSAAHVVATARRPKWVSPEVAQAYRRAYDALSMVPGTAVEPQRKARAWGWAPPLAWDDATIDDPTAKPARLTGESHRQNEVDHAAVELALAGDLTHLTRTADKQATIAQLAAWHLDYEEIAERLEIEVDSVRASLRRQRQRAERQVAV